MDVDEPQPTYDELVESVRVLAKRQKAIIEANKTLRDSLLLWLHHLEEQDEKLLSADDALRTEIRHLREIVQSHQITMTALVRPDEPRAQKVFTAFLDRSRESWVKALRRRIYKYFNMGDLEMLCADLLVPIEDFPDDGKTVLIKDICDYLSNRSRLDELAAYCKQQRPDPAIEWPLEAAAVSTSELVQ